MPRESRLLGYIKKCSYNEEERQASPFNHSTTFSQGYYWPNWYLEDCLGYMGTDAFDVLIDM